MTSPPSNCSQENDRQTSLSDWKFNVKFKTILASLGLVATLC